MDRVGSQPSTRQTKLFSWSMVELKNSESDAAHTDRDYGWDDKEHSLGLGALLGSVGQAAVSHYSFETLELFREAMARLSRERVAARLQTNDSQPLEISTYTIELRFNHLARQVEHQLDAF